MCLLISQYHPRPLLRNPSERSNGLHQAPHHRRKADARARIIADAAVRRFQCQRSYLRAHAGMRWMDSRSQILRGQRPNASHFAALQAADNNLRMVRWRSPTPPIPPYMHNHLELPDPNTLAGTPRHHRHPRRLHPPQRRRPAGEMARRRPLPDSNPADAPEPIIPPPPSPHRAGVHAIGEPNPFSPPGRLPSAPAPKQKQKPNTKKKNHQRKSSFLPYNDIPPNPWSPRPVFPYACRPSPPSFLPRFMVLERLGGKKPPLVSSPENRLHAAYIRYSPMGSVEECLTLPRIKRID